MPVPLYLPYEFTSVLMDAGNANPFGVDPELTTVLNVETTPIQDFLLESGFPLLLESGATLRLEQMTLDPFGIDPERTTLIT
jgi:hypothetical protein